MEEKMGYAGRRPMGRLFYWALILITAFGLALSAFGAAPQSGAATTTVSDTVYQADGSAASGTLIITWPAFVTASELIVGAGGVQAFPAGTLIAVDVDYQQQTGYVGTGIAGAYVRSAAAVQEDPNYVRRVTFNVARVAEVTATSIVLAQPLVGGAPANGASVQRVVAFVDREGGSFFQEWSALFVAQEENGGRVCFYYPRLSPNPGSAPGTSWNSGSSGVLKASASNSGRYVREEYSEIAKPLTAISLRASFLALPYIDANDGQTVLCYRSYFPAGMAASY